MAKVALVRCMVRSAGKEPVRSVRYVPLDIFELWKYLMEHRHGFAVEEETAGAWMDGASYEASRKTLGPSPHPAVTQVSFRYPSRQGAPRQVVRYFPEEEFRAIREYFLAHFPDPGRGEVLETPGVFIPPGEGARGPS